MYLIFGGERYYASGGGFDLLGTSESLDTAMNVAAALVGKLAVTEIDEDDATGEFDQMHDIQWTHVFSVKDEKVIASFGEKVYGGCPTIEVRSE